MKAFTRDRRRDVIGSAAWNGIDFVEVADAAQTRLRVHFLNVVRLAKIPAPTITGGETIPTVAVGPVDDNDWSVDDGHLVLLLRVAAPGDFSRYTLTIADPAVDRFFESASFSFKAACPSDLDCETPQPACPPPAGELPPIDYLAKDFLSFRQALLDFSAQRYPDWQERSEADFGVMFLEALAALADDLSYVQDRIAAEATLDTATQRRSVTRHARLVDYEPSPGLSARVLLQLDVDEGVTELPAGMAAIAVSPEGAPIVFEMGDGLASRGIDLATSLPAATYTVSAAWNSDRIAPYWWDDSTRCLHRGATEMWVLGHGFGFSVGQALLIDTAAADTADPPIREIVHLSEPPLEVCDPLTLLDLPRPGDPPAPPILVCAGSMPGGDKAPAAVTLLRWGVDEALRADHDLRRTAVAGNLLPATQGRTVIGERFVIPGGNAAPPRGVPLAAARLGPNPGADSAVWQYLRTLDGAPLAWLAYSAPATDAADTGPLPELLLVEESADPPAPWPWVRRLLDADSFQAAFTLDAAAWHPVARLPDRPGGDPSVVVDYDGDQGDTLRFGDGTFGEIPAEGAVFSVTYRVGAWSAGNVGADAITRPDPRATGVRRVTNPLPAVGGVDPEPLDRVRRRAPFAFRAPPPLRAVRPEDYRAVAETLPWVQRAGTSIRWTGSWLSVFTTPDPRGTETLAIGPHLELIRLLDRRRMAGTEAFVPPPHYVSLDLVVEVCARADAFRGDVKAGILAALTGTAVSPPPRFFFSADTFTFGTPLERSRLDAAVQAVPGVAGVTCLHVRVRGRTPGYVELPDVLAVAGDEIIRLDNDPSRPNAGSLHVTVLGGK